MISSFNRGIRGNFVGDCQHFDWFLGRILEQAIPAHDTFGLVQVVLAEHKNVGLVDRGALICPEAVPGTGWGIAHPVQGFIRRIENEIRILAGCDLIREPVEGNVRDHSEFIRDALGAVIMDILELRLEFRLKHIAMYDGTKPGLRDFEMVGALPETAVRVQNHPVHDHTMPVGYFLDRGGFGHNVYSFLKRIALAYCANKFNATAGGLSSRLILL